MKPQKIDLFTLQGTGHRATDKGKACFPVHVALGVNQDLFNWRPIFYPAGVPFTRSVRAGKTNLRSAMRTLRFNGPPVIVCYSQGAMVAADVADSDEVLRVVTMGSPVREAGHTYPDCPISPAGHGIMDANHRLQNTPDFWHDCVIPNDLAACMGDSDADQFVTKIFMLLSEKTTFFDVPAILMRNNIPLDHLSTAMDLLPLIKHTNNTVIPHGQYDTYQLPDGRTYIETVIESLNQLGEETLGV